MSPDFYIIESKTFNNSSRNWNSWVKFLGDHRLDFRRLFLEFWFPDEFYKIFKQKILIQQNSADGKLFYELE